MREIKRGREATSTSTALTPRANNIVLKRERLSNPFPICSACSFFSVCSFRNLFSLLLLLLFLFFFSSVDRHSLHFICFSFMWKRSVVYALCIFFFWVWNTLDGNSCCQQNWRPKKTNNRMQRHTESMDRICVFVSWKLHGKTFKQHENGWCGKESRFVSNIILFFL